VTTLVCASKHYWEAKQMVRIHYKIFGGIDAVLYDKQKCPVCGKQWCRDACIGDVLAEAISGKVP
jgi:hypothetical protein